nr:carboxyl transferase domain-containing protein [Marinitoga lauensis]
MEKIEEYKKEFANPYVAAGRGYIEDVIDPRETRKVLIQTLFMSESKAEARPNKKHGNIPL